MFVGREDELATLRVGLDEALSGRARIRLLVGEPGIGKTRTSEELVTYASMRGSQVLWGRCYEGEGAPPYWPWMQIIRAYVHDCEPRTLASEMGPAATDIAEIVSDVRVRLLGLPEPQRLEPEQARFRLFDGIATFLRNAARRQPLVLVLDDLHWADKPSLLMLGFLANALGSERLLVIGTYRDVELRRQHPLADTLAELARNPACERVLLRGLHAEDVARFIERTTSKAPPRELADAVFRETEGNPFFVTEVVRLLATDGRLDRPQPGGSWSLEIPQGVREVVGRRLNHLSEASNEILSLASVIGREFDLSVLQRATGGHQDAILGALDEAVSARLISAMSEAVGRYRFSHALIREALYEELTTPRRVRLHGRVGAVIEELHGGAEGPHLAEISHHAFQALQAGGGIERAVAAATRAGDWAVARQAHAEAAAHYERAVQALDLAESRDAARLAPLAVRQAELRMEAGEGESGKAAALRAAALAREVGDAALLARAALAYGSSFPVIEMGRSDATMTGLLEEALAAIGPEDSLLRVRLLDRLASELFFTADIGRIQSVRGEAVAVARRLDDPNAIASALVWFAQSRLTWTAAELERGVAIQDEVIAQSERAGNAGLLHMGLITRHGYFLGLGRRDAMDRDRRRIAEMVDELRTPRARYFAAMHEAMLAYLEGRFEDGDRLSLEGFRLGRNAMAENALQWYACQRLSVAGHQGIVQRSELAERLAARFQHYPVYDAALLASYALADDREAARQVFERLAAGGFDFPEDGNYGPCCYLAAGACLYLDDRERAAVPYQKLLPTAGVFPFLGAGIALLGSQDAQLARLATLLGRFDDAERHFLNAQARLEALGAWPWFAQCQHDHARMKLLRGAAGDREQALELINASLERAQSLGMKPLLENAIARKLDAQGSASGTFHAQHSIDIVAHRVDRERPDLSATAAPDGTVTLVFSDMEGFTAMTERLGDLRAREVIRAHNRIVRVQVAAHGGYEVELQGDGFLLAFGSARRALHCAIAIQRAMAAHSAEHPEEPLRVRIGLHTGEALREADKFFGRTVILAARIAAQALGGEILASAVIHELARSGGDVCFGDRRLLELKGIAEPQSVYEVDWTTGRRCFRGCPARPLPSRTRPMARLGWLRIARRHSPTGAERHRMRRDPSRTVSKEPAPPVGWGEWAHSLKLVRMLVSHRIRFRPTTEAPPLAGVRVRP